MVKKTKTPLRNVKMVPSLKIRRGRKVTLLNPEFPKYPDFMRKYSFLKIRMPPPEKILPHCTTVADIMVTFLCSFCLETPLFSFVLLYTSYPGM